MKIGHKIALLYSAITICTVATVFSVLYYWASDYTDRIYYSFLEERALLLAKEHIYQQERISTDTTDQDPDSDEEILHPQSAVVIPQADNRKETEETLLKIMSARDIRNLYRNKTLHFKSGECLGAALYYPKEKGNFMVVVVSNQHFGSYMHRQLGYLLLGIVAACSAIIFFVSKLYALHRINALDEAYHREKEFIHHASHELNNPLTAIQGECEITLLKPRLPDEYQDSLQRIATEAERMNQMIHQLLTLAHTMDQGNKSECEWIALNSFLTQFQTERIRLSIAPKGGSACLTANPFLLKMALDNLLGNALKYSDGVVQIHLDERYIEITDVGIGIPEEELKLIMQPFYRASNTRAYKGHGIGMSLAVRILKLYGIQTSIRSKVNCGTVIVLKLPRTASGQNTTTNA